MECPKGAKLIPLTQGRFAIVDEVDFDWLNQWKWFARHHRNTFYASRNIRQNGKRRTIDMQNSIMRVPKGYVVDHNNMNGLDDRRKNLRPASNKENLRNTNGHRDRKSKYKGVHWSNYNPKRRRGKWVAQICVDGKQTHIGYFDTEKEAAIAYNIKAEKCFGKFARLNNV